MADVQILCGKLAVDAGYVKKEHVEECVRLQEELEAQGQYKQLGQIMIEKGFVDQNRLNFILKNHEYVELRALDRRFGQLAVKNGFTTQQQVEAGLNIQKEEYTRTKKMLPLGTVIVRQGHMTEQQCRAILRAQKRLEPAGPAAQPVVSDRATVGAEGANADPAGIQVPCTDCGTLVPAKNAKRASGDLLCHDCHSRRLASQAARSAPPNCAGYSS